MFFSIHKTYYTAYHETSNVDIITKNFSTKIHDFDFVVLPEAEKVDSLFDNEISKAVAIETINSIKNNNNWQLDTIVETKTYGKLFFYQNLFKNTSK